MPPAPVKIDTDMTKKTSLQRQLERLARDRWARRGVRTLLRMTSLGLSLWAIGVGGHLLFGWPLDQAILQAIVLVAIALGGAMLLRPRMPARRVAQRVDKRFGLQEQITTALEVNSQEQHPEGVAAYLIGKARSNTSQVQRYAAMRQRLPWSEVITLVALLLLAGGLMLLVNIDKLSMAYSSPEQLPPLANPLDIPEEFPTGPFANGENQGNQNGGAGGNESESGEQQAGQQSETQSVSSGADQQSASALADALRDLSVTRPAAEALDQGDTRGAAQSLREVADQAEQLSEQTRQDLSDALQDAASDINPHDPELADQLRDSAYGLQQDAQQSAQAIEDLASAIEQLGENQPQQPQQQAAQQPPPQQQGQQQQQQQQNQGAGGGGAGNDSPPGDQRELPYPPERLNVDGVPLELEGGDEGDTPAEGDEADQAHGTGGGGFERGQSSQDETRIQTGDDPLSIPVDMRDVVQEYFSPSE